MDLQPPSPVPTDKVIPNPNEMELQQYTHTGTLSHVPRLIASSHKIPVLAQLSTAAEAGDAIHVCIRSITTAHNGGMHAMFTSSAYMQAQLMLRVLATAKLMPQDIDILEAHRSRMPVRNMLKLEGIRCIFHRRTCNPLLLSSTKTVLGHCHGSTFLVGLLKVLACFHHRAVLPHHTTPFPELSHSDIIVPTAQCALCARRIFAQVNSSGFTGFVISVVLKFSPPLPLSLLPSLSSWTPPPYQTFFDLIEQYGTPLSPAPVPAPSLTLSYSCVLLTGATGMLGAGLLSLLIQRPNTTIYCPICGANSTSRLESTFRTHNLDLPALHTAHARSALHLLPTQTSAHPHSACTRKTTHAYSTKRAKSLLMCMRTLVQLCIVTSRHVCYFFVGTHTSTFGYKGERVLECAITPQCTDALNQGYAIAEHALLHLAHTHPDIFDLALVCTGQICGMHTFGTWSTNEAVPMLIVSLPTLHALPIEMPDAAWILSDTCTAILADFLNLLLSSDTLFLHVTNPVCQPWTNLAPDLTRIAGTPNSVIFLMCQYIARVRRCLADGPRTNIPIACLLPFFNAMVCSLNFESQHGWGSKMVLEVCELVVKGLAQLISANTPESSMKHSLAFAYDQDLTKKVIFMKVF
ncbi:hypothetical protein K488DRAFT_92409 [Vararia minispora EC-137]|uniref:Uncharacterized protein n=1 Tax=Vararia minispora EC-137 TaxID=1314806 RepID=A0ACB8Q436_9AGAM|nr:hypothetical protein K488DRAFT_92409 [Vararia minispora EC-137]